MALLKSSSTGNFTSSSSWALCTAVSETNTNTFTSTTTSYSFQSANTYSSTVTGNATGVLIKIAGRTSTSGTVSVALADNSANILAECTMNITDVTSSALPTSSTGFGHWIFFKFNSTVAITSGTFYRVGIKTSVNAQLQIHRNTTGLVTMHTAIVTETNQSPAAGDRLIILGDNIADAVSPGTNIGTKSSSIVITMDNTATTEFGDGLGTGSTVPYAAIYVGDNGELTFGTSESTAYRLRIKGNIILGAGGDSYQGKFYIGKTGSPIPRNSTATIEFTSVANGDSSIRIHGGIFSTRGLSRTSGKNSHKCFLNANALISATTLNVDTDTGWLSGDRIWIGPTSRTSRSGQLLTLNADATATTLTTTSGLSAARDGNSTATAPIALIDRNISIKPTAASNAYYATIEKNISVCDCEWTLFEQCGSTASNGQGFYCNGDATKTLFTNCSFYFCGYIQLLVEVENAGFQINNTTITRSQLYGISFASTAISSSTSIIDSWIVNPSQVGIRTKYFNFTVNNILINGSNSGAAIDLVASTQPALNAPSTWSNLNLYCNAVGLSGLAKQAADNQIIFDNATIQRSGGSGVSLDENSYGIIFKNSRIWGNTGSNISAYGGEITFRDCFIASQTGNTTNYGLEYLAYTKQKHIFENCEFGSGFTGAINHVSQDIYYAANLGGQIAFRNCLFNLANPVVNPYYEDVFLVSENHNQISNTKLIWSKNGLIESNTTPVVSGTRSIRLTPNNVTAKLKYVFAKTAVASGTSPTISVYIRKSVAGDGTAYNGNQPRLIAKRNVLIGLSADTVLATATNAANGAWEKLSGVLPTVSQNGILEIYIDCDGTTGWIHIDDFSSSQTVDTRSMEYSDDTLGIVAYGRSTGAAESGLVISNAGEVDLLDKMLKDALLVDEDYMLRLYKNDYTPLSTSTTSDFTEANFTNYVAKTLTRASWSAASTVSNRAETSYSKQTWTCGTTGNTIYGYYLVGATSGTLLWAEKFSLARVLSNNETLGLTPKFILDSTF